MSVQILTCLVLVSAFLVLETNSCGNIGKYIRSRQGFEPPCGMCGRLINVTIALQNVRADPPLDTSITVRHHRRELIYFLEKAAQMDADYTFTAQYYQKWGYFLKSIAGQASDPANNYYWMFYSNGTLLDKGLSSYIPQDDQVILFNFTKTGH